jgi:hypothetical protein
MGNRLLNIFPSRNFRILHESLTISITDMYQNYAFLFYKKLPDISSSEMSFKIF